MTNITTGISASSRHGVILLLAAVMPPMAIISLVPVLPLLLDEFASVKGSEFLVPIAMTVPALCVALFSPVAGWLSDRVGRKNLLVLALVIYAAIGIVPFFLSDLKQIIAARVGLGVAEAIIMTIATALIGDYFTGKERRTLGWTADCDSQPERHRVDRRWRHSWPDTRFPRAIPALSSGASCCSDCCCHSV